MNIPHVSVYYSNLYDWHVLTWTEHGTTILQFLFIIRGTVLSYYTLFLSNIITSVQTWRSLTISSERYLLMSTRKAKSHNHFLSLSSMTKPCEDISITLAQWGAPWMCHCLDLIIETTFVITLLSFRECAHTLSWCIIQWHTTKSLGSRLLFFICLINAVNPFCWLSNCWNNLLSQILSINQIFVSSMHGLRTQQFLCRIKFCINPS